jgi:hypothetical protein
MGTMNSEKVDLAFDDLARAFFMNHDRIVVARAEGSEFSAIGDGVKQEKPLPWDRGKRVVAAVLERVVVIKTGGACTSFDIEIRTKEGGTGLDIAYQYMGSAVPTLDKALDPPVPYLSEESGSKRFSLYVAITPHGGDGTFKARIYARPRR